MYERFEVATPDGVLTVGRWGDAETVVLAAHGVTGNHMDFAALADALGSEVTLVAPDLRGRGGSNGIASPFGMAAHADDMRAVLDHLGLERVMVLGHSMGGFVALVTADRHPDRVHRLVLVDGGLPLNLGPLAERPVEELTQLLLGPSLQRLEQTFATPEDYLDFWRPHPALEGEWNDYVERRSLYDLVGEAPNLRSSVSGVAVVEDTKSDLFGGDAAIALENLRHPAIFLRAPRGQFNQVPPLYPDDQVEEILRKVPRLRYELIPDVNHFTILLAERGAKAVAGVVRTELAAVGA